MVDVDFTVQRFAQHFADGIVVGLFAVTITYLAGWALGKLLKLAIGKGV